MTSTPIPLTILQPAGDAPGLLRMLVDGRNVSYEYALFPVEFGAMGIGIRRLPNGELHHVLLNGDGSAECDCRGFVRHGHCRHSEVAADLVVMTAEVLK